MVWIFRLYLTYSLWLLVKVFWCPQYHSGVNNSIYPYRSDFYTSK